ncbi:MAG: GGDEF domain-containing protein [Proteobacteria bacterium]|nr:GGDEF domain-containing protein [Pseudomonadota bacterium]
MDHPYRQFSDEELKHIHLFSSVSLESIKGLLESCSTFELEPDMVLIRPGEINHTVYFLLKGYLRIHLDKINSEPIAILGPGESVGEMSIIDQQPTSAFVVADEYSRLLVMDEDVLWSLVQASHAAACNLLFIMTKRLRHTDLVIVEGTSIEQVYSHYGSVDALTGLHNRYWVDNALKRQFARSLTSGSPLSIIMIDIDHFKKFNDLYGHQFGDSVLYSVAHIMSEHLRPTELIARYGGDQFIIVLPGYNIRKARVIAERVQKEVNKAEPLVLSGKTLHHPSISIGIAERKKGQTLELLIAGADSALYMAKTSGRNCISE